MIRDHLERKKPWMCPITCWKENGVWYRSTFTGVEKLGRYGNDPPDAGGKKGGKLYENKELLK